MLLATVAVLGVLALWWFTRTGELFCISVRGGKLLVVRGRAPGGFISEARAIVSRASVTSGTIRALKTERGGRLVVSGAIDERTEQRLRNLFALYPASQLRQAPAIAKPSFGQLLGIAWLAWLLDRSA
jgi:Protein of unknown function (DUF3634)